MEKTTFGLAVRYRCLIVRHRRYFFPLGTGFVFSFDFHLHFFLGRGPRYRQDLTGYDLEHNVFGSQFGYLLRIAPRAYLLHIFSSLQATVAWAMTAASPTDLC
jgi:hypothetical protein